MKPLRLVCILNPATPVSSEVEGEEGMVVYVNPNHVLLVAYAFDEDGNPDHTIIEMTNGMALRTKTTVEQVAKELAQL